MSSLLLRNFQPAHPTSVSFLDDFHLPGKNPAKFERPFLSEPDFTCAFQTSYIELRSAMLEYTNVLRCRSSAFLRGFDVSVV